MSKIGEKPIEVSQEIKIEIGPRKVTVVGKDGQVEFDTPGVLDFSMSDGKIVIKRKRDDKKAKSLHGLYRSLIANAVEGVNKPWERKLEVVGTGYNVKMSGEDLEFKLGYSHPLIFKVVPGIKYSVEGNNKITVSGVDKQLVGQIAYQIKQLKKPDAYKGKGVKYEGERLKIKPGKKAKTGAGATQ